MEHEPDLAHLLHGDDPVVDDDVARDLAREATLHAMSARGDRREPPIDPDTLLVLREQLGRADRP